MTVPQAIIRGRQEARPQWTGSSSLSDLVLTSAGESILPRIVGKSAEIVAPDWVM
jgi:hypothetical protein